METYPADEQEVRYYAGVLRHAIRAAGFSVSEVERQLGAGPKALRRVFGGQVDLKFKHVVAVLRVIGMPQEEFFAIAASRRRKRRSPGGELLAMLHLGQRAEAPPPADVEASQSGHAGAPLSDNAFDDLVEEAVNRVMERRARQSTAPGQAPPARLAQRGSALQDDDLDDLDGADADLEAAGLDDPGDQRHPGSEPLGAAPATPPSPADPSADRRRRAIRPAAADGSEAADAGAGSPPSGQDAAPPADPKDPAGSDDRGEDLPIRCD